VSNSDQPASPDQKIPRRLWFILGLLFAASFLNYLDRQTLSVLKPTIKTAFTLDEPGYALLVNVFTACYAAAYIGTGIVVDWLGVRRAYTGFVVAWSVAAIGSGLARTLSVLTASRALLGLAEPAHAPTSVRVAALWFPAPRRALLMTVAAAGGTVGAIAAPPLTAWLALGWSWRAAFVVPGVAGVLLAAVWWMVYRDPVRAAGGAGSAVATRAFAWSQLWRQKSLWGFILVRLVSDPVWYFLLFWMPGYFQEQRGLSLKAAGFVGWIPFLTGNLGAIACAAYSDRLGVRLGDPLRARKRVLVGVALLGPLAAFVPGISQVGGVVTLLAIIAIVCLGWLFLLGTLVTDSFPAGNAASVWAIAGAFGAAGAMVFNYSVGQITTSLGSDRMFLIMAVMHPLAAVLLVWLVHKTKSPADEIPIAAGA
jgi:ACS family hexuronate transporter-like MFS transporter